MVAYIQRNSAHLDSGKRGIHGTYILYNIIPGSILLGMAIGFKIIYKHKESVDRSYKNSWIKLTSFFVGEGGGNATILRLKYNFYIQPFKLRISTHSPAKWYILYTSSIRWRSCEWFREFRVFFVFFIFIYSRFREINSSHGNLYLKPYRSCRVQYRRTVCMQT